MAISLGVYPIFRHTQMSLVIPQLKGSIGSHQSDVFQKKSPEDASGRLQTFETSWDEQEVETGGND